MSWPAPFLMLALVAGSLHAFSPADRASVRALDAAYVEAWRADDPEGVLSLFTDDAVIIPSGMQPIRGLEAMRGFWWPDDGSKTVVTSYTTRIDEVRGSGDIAWAWGSGRLAFTWSDGETSSAHASDSVFTLVARRNAAGEWRLTHRMWTDVKPRAGSAPSPLVDRAKEFRALLESKRFEPARRLMAADPRRWWETREGRGMPWTVGPDTPGPWARWDEHFGSEKEILRWREGERSATAVVRETNDYFRLLERPAVTNEITYFFDEAGRIDGLLIRGAGERPPGRTAEFLAWAGAHAPDELAAVMPGGEIDPADPERFRRLLNRWRRASGGV